MNSPPPPPNPVRTAHVVSEDVVAAIPTARVYVASSQLPRADVVPNQPAPAFATHQPPANPEFDSSMEALTRALDEFNRCIHTSNGPSSSEQYALIKASSETALKAISRSISTGSVAIGYMHTSYKQFVSVRRASHPNTSLLIQIIDNMISRAALFDQIFIQVVSLETMTEKFSDAIKAAEKKIGAPILSNDSDNFFLKVCHWISNAFSALSAWWYSVERFKSQGNTALDQVRNYKDKLHNPHMSSSLNALIGQDLLVLYASPLNVDLLKYAIAPISDLEDVLIEMAKTLDLRVPSKLNWNC